MGAQAALVVSASEAKVRAAVMAYILQQRELIDAALWDLEAVYE